MKIFYLLVFIIFSVFTLHAQNADIRILRSINPDVHNTMVEVARTESDLTHSVAFALPVGIILTGLAEHNKEAETKGAIIFSSVFVADVVNYGFKSLIRRPRPYITYPDLHVWGPGISFSMPSGHSAEAFGLATALSIAYPHWYVIVPAYAWAGSVAYSRMVLGVHYPTDVITGAVEGSAVVLGVYYAEKAYLKNIRLSLKISG